ncbi:MAG: hypothetical protein JSR61_01555 [Proteobacteria bacterium]|nr:hypothetical protein [Pseudomonadota bacterium]
MATFKLAAAGFAIAALAVGGWTLLSAPERLAPLLSAIGGSSHSLDFSGDRLGRASTAPLLKVCIDMEPYLNGSANELEPADILKILEGGDLQSRGVGLLGGKVNRKAEVSLALSWGGLADCVYRQGASRLCDIDNRALAVEAGSSFIRRADRIVAGGGQAAAADLQTMRAIRDRVLEALQRHLHSGVLVAADFSSFTPTEIRNALKATEPARNDCKPL